MRRPFLTSNINKERYLHLVYLHFIIGIILYHLSTSQTLDNMVERIERGWNI